MLELLRAAAPPVLAIACAYLVDQGCARRGLLPPAFSVEGAGAPARAWARRVAAGTVLALILWIGVFASLGSLGTSSEVDLSTVAAPQLFLLHFLMLLAVACWCLLGFGADGSRWMRQLGLVTGRLLVELGIGVAAGVAAWMGVILVMISSALGLWALGGGDLLPRSAPPLVPWLAGLPLVLRLAVSASAGVAEEIFFRGFLQPRVGIALSTGLFVLAHLSYEQPFMLLGVMLLSVVFALLVRWRQNVWAAVVAHAVFDAIQLTIMIPWALGQVEKGALPVALLL